MKQGQCCKMPYDADNLISHYPHYVTSPIGDGTDTERLSNVCLSPELISL